MNFFFPNKSTDYSTFFHVILKHTVNASYPEKIVLKRGRRGKRKVFSVSNSTWLSPKNQQGDLSQLSLTWLGICVEHVFVCSDHVLKVWYFANENIIKSLVLNSALSTQHGYTLQPKLASLKAKFQRRNIALNSTSLKINEHFYK